LRNSAGGALPDTTTSFSTLRNQVEKSVYYKADGSIQRGQLYTPLADVSEMQRNSVESVSPGADGIWFTSDDVIGSKEDLIRYTSPPQTYKNSYLWEVSALQEVYDYAATGNLTRQTFNPRAGSTFGITEYTYNGFNSLDRQTHYLNSGVDGVWGTADDVVGSYTKYEYDPTGVILAEISYRLVAPDGTVLPSEQIVSYVYNYYDAQGLLNKKITYESPGAHGIWLDNDDVVSGYWEYAYSSGQLIAAGFYGAAGADGTWFTADDTLLAYILYSYDASGNRTIGARFNGTGADLKWFTADDRLAVVDFYDTTR
jgi:hypothetical protein